MKIKIRDYVKILDVYLRLYAAVAQLVEASDLKFECCGFKSHSRQIEWIFYFNF